MQEVKAMNCRSNCSLPRLQKQSLGFTVAESSPYATSYNKTKEQPPPKHTENVHKIVQVLLLLLGSFAPVCIL